MLTPRASRMMRSSRARNMKKRWKFAGDEHAMMRGAAIDAEKRIDWPV
jgi:hypothetical protein